MAVIRWTGCISTSIRIVQGIVLFVVLLGAATVSANPQGCDVARKEIIAKGFANTGILDRPSSGSICGENSCCSGDLEKDMLRQNQLHIDKFLRDSISKLQSVIDVRARKFDGFFREMMNNSKREFHDMFQKTYGKIYLQNSDVFSDFFAELEIYYKKGSVRLSETLETFFGILYQRMFTVINSQYTFDEKYLECVSEHMVEMKPFGDVPHKLSMQLRRSFVATRTYYKSLMMGADVASKMVNLKIDDDCAIEMVKMQNCAGCKGESMMVVACSNYCTTTMESCLRFHTAFNPEWDKFVDALDKVADRLVGPFNIEMVVEPLNIKISEAIMNFQESGTEVSKKIYSLCGKPTLTRRKRKTNNKKDIPDDNPLYEIKYEPVKMHGKKKKNKKLEEDDVPTLEKLIKEIKTKVRETRQFWLQLPYQYCNNPAVSAPPSENDKCWNGSMVGMFDKVKTKPVEGGTSSVVNEQIYNLQMLSDKLRKAHQGDEVEIIDDSDESLDGSGSGSGDSGLDQEEDDDETEVSVSSNIDDIEVPPEEFPEEIPPPVPTTTRKPEDPKTYSNANTISLSKALAQYLLPIVLVWFGGAISDLL